MRISLEKEEVEYAIKEYLANKLLLNSFDDLAVYITTEGRATV